MEARVGENGTLVLEHLPFEPGQPVEVLVVSSKAPSSSPELTNLQGSVLEYHDPFEPVADADWEALR